MNTDVMRATVGQPEYPRPKNITESDCGPDRCQPYARHLSAVQRDFSTDRPMDGRVLVTESVHQSGKPAGDFSRGTPMQHILARAQEQLSDDNGATAVEYGMLVAAIAAIIVTAVFLLGTKVGAAFDAVNNVWK
jgi:pilus assembly protein Flp/PilA